MSKISAAEITAQGTHQVSFRFYAGLFVVSFALLYLEILINRVFSYVLWANLAYLVISIALLGLGAGAVWDAVVFKPAARPEARLSRAGLASSLSLVAVFMIIGRIPMAGGFSIVIPLMVLYYILSFIPFFFMGLILATIFRVQVKQVGWIYGINMGASGLACLAALGSLRLMGAESGILLSAALLSLSAILFAPPEDRKVKWICGVLCFIWIMLLALRPPIFDFQSSGVKEIWFFKENWPDFRLEYQKWTPVGRVDVFSSKQSVLTIGDQVFPYKCITIDGAANTAMFQQEPDMEKTSFYEGTVYGQGYLLSHRDRVLIIGAGGGTDVKTALHFKAKNIVAVEVNKESIRIVQELYHDYVGAIYDQPGVSIVHADGRSFLSRSREKYDLIQISAIDTFSAIHWGAYMHSENYIFTKEAFVDYFRHLSPEGVVAVFQYEPFPPRIALRTCSIALSALRELGAEHPENHFIVLRQGIWVVALIKKSPLGPEEIEAYLQRLDQSQIRKVINFKAGRFHREKVNLRILYAPGHLKENLFSKFFQMASRNEEGEFIRSYDYDVSVSTDNSPFFHKYYTWQFRLGSAGSIGFYIMLVQLLQSLLLCLIFIYLPIRVFRRREVQPMRHHRMIAIYFLCLGLGYMFVEITLIQRLSLYLGHPMYSMALVLAALLISSGTGAALFQKSAFAEKNLVSLCALAILFFLSVFCLWLLPVFIEKTLFWPLGARFIASGLWVAPLGLAMGVPFPAGLRMLGRSQSHAVPWAFGINAAASVVGSILCVFLAMEVNFSAVLITAAGLYLLAGLFIRVFPSAQKTSPEPVIQA